MFLLYPLSISLIGILFIVHFIAFCTIISIINLKIDDSMSLVAL